MITLLLTFLGSSGFGSILGGIIGFLNRKVDLQQKALDLAHEKDKWAHELELRQADLDQVKAEAAGKREVAVVEGESSIETARMVALTAAQAADRLEADELKAAGWWGWALVLPDALRRLIRPVTTVVLLAITLYIDSLLIDKLTGTDWASIPAADRLQIAKEALSWISGQTAAVLGFWFVSRGGTK